MVLMRVNVHELEVHKEVHFTFSEDKKTFKIEEGDLDCIKGEIKGDLTFTKARGVIVGKGNLSFQARLQCSRCLEYKTITIERDFYHIYEQSVTEEESPEEVELSVGDLDVTGYRGDEIIINKDVRDEVLLGIPEFFFCSVDCNGLCDACGANLNENQDHECGKMSYEEEWKKKLRKKYREEQGGNNNGGS